MKREATIRKFILLFAVLVVSAFASSQAAYAQATRTWVSGAGTDSGSCPRTAPCASFAYAITQTNAGGEINCLDAGGYGAVTITKAIAIICDNVEAGVLVSGTNGITVNAGANDVVFLSGLDIEGAGAGLAGILYSAGKTLFVKNCVIRGFTGAGIQVAPSAGTSRLVVADTVVDSNGGTGILVKPTGSGSAQAVIVDTHVANNGGDGIMSNANVTSGVVSVVVRNSTSAQNAKVGFVAFSSAGSSTMIVQRSVAFQNDKGIAASGSNAIVRFADNAVTGNNMGIYQTNPNTALSYGTNSINGNTSDGTFGTVALQ
jgi:hypothetical protein